MKMIFKIIMFLLGVAGAIFFCWPPIVKIMFPYNLPFSLTSGGLLGWFGCDVVKTIKELKK